MTSGRQCYRPLVHIRPKEPEEQKTPRLKTTDIKIKVFSRGMQYISKTPSTRRSHAPGVFPRGMQGISKIWPPASGANREDAPSGCAFICIHGQTHNNPHCIDIKPKRLPLRHLCIFAVKFVKIIQQFAIRCSLYSVHADHAGNACIIPLLTNKATRTVSVCAGDIPPLLSPFPAKKHRPLSRLSGAFWSL